MTFDCWNAVDEFVTIYKTVDWWYYLRSMLNKIATKKCFCLQPNKICFHSSAKAFYMTLHDLVEKAKQISYSNQTFDPIQTEWRPVASSGFKLCLPES